MADNGISGYFNLDHIIGLLLGRNECPIGSGLLAVFGSLTFLKFGISPSFRNIAKNIPDLIA